MRQLGRTYTSQAEFGLCGYGAGPHGARVPGRWGCPESQAVAHGALASAAVVAAAMAAAGGDASGKRRQK